MKRIKINTNLNLYFLFTLLFVTVNFFAQKNTSKKPNFIVILTDDQSWVGTSFLANPNDQRSKSDYYHTPNMERLANYGMRMTNGYAPAPFCSPTRKSILTGLTPAKHEYQKDRDNWTTAFRKQMTIPKILKLADSNYVTAHFGKWDARYDHFTPEEMGYDFSDGLTSNNTGGGKSTLSAEGKETPFKMGDAWPKTYDDPKLIFSLTQRSNDFIEEQTKKNKPFFLYFAPTISHGPDRLGTKHKGNPLATPIGFLDKPLDVMPDRATLEQRISEAGLAQDRTDILWLDDGIGAILNKLKETGALENTVIFFINDHGVEKGKGTLYDGGIKTVSFAWGPKYFKSGIRSKQLVSNIDMVPTALELAKVDPKKAYKIDGSSMLPLLQGKDKPIHESLYFEMGATRAVIKDGYKYLSFKAPQSIKNKLEKNGKKTTHICDKPGGRGSESPALKFYAKNYFDSDQLYDLSADPKEQQNLYGEFKNSIKLYDLKKTLQSYVDQVPGTFPIDLKKPSKLKG